MNKISFLKTLIIIFFSLFFSGNVTANAGKTHDKDAILGLIRRILPKHHKQFDVAFISQKNNKDVFSLSSPKGRILLQGSNGVSIASALNFYLKKYGHCDIGWNGTNLNLPKKLPLPKSTTRNTPYTYRYYLNYCTFNYTMSWWDWERWQKEIDWMAMNGINMPLAVTGQNSVWQRVYNKLGFSNKELESFFSGPAYFNWFWMGNLDGWGGPLPQSFLEQHEELQKKILARERSLGMTPILPAFTGHVPPTFNKHFPNAKLKQTSWQGFEKTNILDPGDPIFVKIGQSFIAEQTKTYGTDHFYSADTFNENTPPTNDSLYLNDVSKKVYESMHGADSLAKWVMQGWLFSYEAKFWQPTQIKALLNAVPDDRMIILDLYSETKPVWNRTDAYYGKPWIWCMLHNFGGNISLFGRMDVVANGPANALKDPTSGKLTGIGVVPEAIEQNPVMYELMLDNVWRDEPIEIVSWLKDYAHRRYGAKNIHAEKAWQVLHKTVYDGAKFSGGPESIITGRPTFNKTTRWTNPRKAYHPEDLLPAWENLIAAAPQLKNSEGYRYDLIDVTRQVMANYADTLQQSFALAYKEKDFVKFNEEAKKFLNVIDEMDVLLASQKDFLLGNWLNDARKMGKTTAEKDLYEKNARNLITLWGNEDSPLNDYACKQWSGMLSDFYRPRWEQFFAYVNDMQQHPKLKSLKGFEKQIKNWEWKWVHDKKVFPTETKGNAVTVALAMHKKYAPLIAAVK